MSVKTLPLINIDATSADMRCERERLFWERFERRESTIEEPLTTGVAQDLINECDTDFPRPALKLLTSFITQRAYRENEIQLALQMLEQVDAEDTEALENIEDLVFPRNFTSCDRGGDNECLYFHRCFDRAE